MRELTQMVPDGDVLLSLAPEELGAKLVFLLRKYRTQTYSLHNLRLELWHNSMMPGAVGAYPNSSRDEIDLAISEAWAWLTAQGLLVPAAGTDGWQILSRRALAYQDETEIQRFAVARLLRKELLHARIAQPVWSAFVRGEYDVAVFQAMKAVEIAVREASKLHSELGVNLMRKAFDPKNGPLTNLSSEIGEREARANLFAGTIGSFKNPHSHRDVQLSDPAEAIEVIMLANHLLRVVDARKSP